MSRALPDDRSVDAPPPRLVDAHCHLDLPAFDEDRDAVVARARAAGVEALVLPGTGPEAWEGLARTRDALPLPAALCLGVHPEWLGGLDDDALSSALAELPRALERYGAVGLGETGLDKRIEASVPAERQAEAARAQLGTARALGLPLVLHVVRRHGAMLALLDEAGPARGMVHAFAGPAELVPAYVERGFYLSVGGAATRPGARRVRAAVKAIPAERLLLETDAPDLTPAGAPTTRNEPAYLRRVLAAVAALRGEPEDELAERSAANARRLFAF
ncbi:MAG: TatD family hydrolase [Myxococcota bacterium]